LFSLRLHIADCIGVVAQIINQHIRVNQQLCRHSRAQSVGPIRGASLSMKGDRSGLSTYHVLAAADSSYLPTGTARSIASRRRGRSRLAFCPGVAPWSPALFVPVLSNAVP